MTKAIIHNLLNNKDLIMAELPSARDLHHKAIINRPRPNNNTPRSSNTISILRSNMAMTTTMAEVVDMHRITTKDIKI
jgi:hypothetical protein